MSSLSVRVTVAHHPLERLAQSLAISGHRLAAAAASDPVVQDVRALLNRSPAAYWQQCDLCSPGFTPNAILKHEYLNLDLLYLVKDVLSFNTAGLEDVPDNFYEVQDIGVSVTAKEVYGRMRKSDVRRIFEHYRIDHELFGYDPGPYIDLGHGD